MGTAWRGRHLLMVQGTATPETYGAMEHVGVEARPRTPNAAGAAPGARLGRAVAVAGVAVVLALAAMTARAPATPAPAAGWVAALGCLAATACYAAAKK